MASSDSVSKVTKRRDAKQTSEKDGSRDKIVKQSKDTTTQPEEKDKPLRYGRMPRISKERIISRGVFIFGVIIYVWYTSRGGKLTSLAVQKEVLQQRGMAVDCDQEFADEIAYFPGCVPKKCGRYVSDKIVTSSEAEALLKVAKKGIALGGSEGGASVLDLHSGALSYGKKFVNVYSMEESKKLFTPQDLNTYKLVKEKIKRQIAQIYQIDSDSLYLTHPTFFSKLNNRDPQTDHDEYWHPHIDKVTYESFHYTSLLYLSDHGIDFKGGRLVFIDGPMSKPKGNVTVEPRKGRVTMFTSGAENVHFVEKVTSGDRYAITVSFTCDISKSIGDPTGTYQNRI